MFPRLPARTEDQQPLRSRGSQPQGTEGRHGRSAEISQGSAVDDRQRTLVRASEEHMQGSRKCCNPGGRGGR